MNYRLEGKRACIVCAALVSNAIPMTAHEFMCYKKAPECVPLNLQPEFHSTLRWEKRSNTAKAVWKKRKAASHA